VDRAGADELPSDEVGELEAADEDAAAPAPVEDAGGRSPRATGCCSIESLCSEPRLGRWLASRYRYSFVSALTAAATRSGTRLRWTQPATRQALPGNPEVNLLPLANESDPGLVRLPITPQMPQIVAGPN
jgi:hypothetical protein